MSLFPAFSNDLEKPSRVIINSTEEPKKESWLQNLSYSCVGSSSEKLPENPVVENAIPRDTPIAQRKRSHSPVHHHHHHKKKKKKSKSHKESKKDKGSKRTFQDHPSDKFCEDRVKCGGNLTVNTLYRPAVPLYLHKFRIPLGVSRHHPLFHSWKSSGKQGRYFFRVVTDSNNDNATEESESKAGEEVISEFMNWGTCRLEKEVHHATESFSQMLAEKPHDVHLWMDFIRFQERASELQFRGGCSKTALAKRKLVILEKALRENPRSWLLVREKTQLEQLLYPADELEEKLGKDAKKSNNLLPWLSFLEVLRARGTTTDVSTAYGKAMETAQKEGRSLQKQMNSTSVINDERIIDLYFSCGLYMRQAGLWERLLTLMRMYLEFNMTSASNDKDGAGSNITFDFGRQPNDAEVDELETEVLKSGLPLSEMWLRVESLRQSVRWLPLLPSDKDETDGDLQRIVFPEDVSELFHPLSTAGRSSNGIIARLATVTLLLLKVPLLPCRDTTVRRHAFPSWNCDTPEIHLTAVFSGGPWEWGKNVLPLDLLGEMIVGGGGPQYLIPRPGRDLYLESIRKLFLILTDVAGSSTDQQFFGVWWLRFERWLIILEGCKLPKFSFSLPKTWKKQLKTILKEFLSKEKNRSSLALYREYALLDAALGKDESSIRTLRTAAALGGCPVAGAKDRSELCSIYRTLAESLIKRGIDMIPESQIVKPHVPTNSNDLKNQEQVLKQDSPAPKNIDDAESAKSSEPSGSLDRRKESGANDLAKSDQTGVCGSDVISLTAKDVDTASSQRKDSGANDLVTSDQTGEGGADVISLNAKDVDAPRSRWDMRNPSVGAGGRRPRWTAAGIFMGSVFNDESLNVAQSNQSKSSQTDLEKSEVGKSAKEKVSKSVTERTKVDKPGAISSSLCEQQAISVLTCLGLGKPLTSLEESMDKCEIDLSLQKYKHVTQEILDGEDCSCQEPCDCQCDVVVSGGSGGIECLQSYFVVEWICCRAWLVCLVESIWAGGAVFEEALTKIRKILPEQMEDDNVGRYNPAIVRKRNIREALYEGYITMFLSRRWFHESRSGTNVILADVIRRALSEFPENMFFAAAVAITENEVGYGGSPWWLVTSYFDGGLGRAGGSNTPSLFGKVILVLLAEQRRRRKEEGEKKGHHMMDIGGPLVMDSSATNRLHSVLRRLIADSTTRNCPLLWRLYIRFVGANVGINECKGVAYRGLQQCQWVKAFYLDAACLLPEETNQFQDLIVEKELRLHVSPEELEILRT